MSIYSFSGRLSSSRCVPITLDLFPITMAWLMVFYHFVKPPKTLKIRNGSIAAAPSIVEQITTTLETLG